MGTISLVQPIIGQPDTTEDVKIQNNFTTLQNVINGNIDDSNLKSPNAAVRKLLASDSNIVSSLSSGGPFTVASTPTFWWGDAGISPQPQDFQVANKTAYARIRAVVLTNNVTPSLTMTFGLYPLGSISGSGFISFTMGTVVTGSTAAIVLNQPDAVFVVESGQFTLPTTSGAYMLGFTTSGSTPANASLAYTAQLYCYNA